MSGASRLAGVAARSARDAWAVGTYADAHGRSKPLVERWDGSAWQLVTVPSSTAALGDNLRAVTVTTDGTVWAVGESTIITGPVAESRCFLVRGTTGGFTVDTAVRSYAGFLTGVSANSPRDVWAVGYDRRKATVQPLLLHWDGRAWTKFKPPVGTPRWVCLTSVAVDGTGGAWAAGASHVMGHFHPLTMHWDGNTWALA